MPPIACYQRDRHGGLHMVDCPFVSDEGVVELVDGKCIYLSQERGN